MSAFCGKTFAMLQSLWLMQFFTPFNTRMVLARTYPHFPVRILYVFSSCDSVRRDKLKITYTAKPFFLENALKKILFLFERIVLSG